MRVRSHAEGRGGETVLLVPILAALVGLLVYLFVVLLPRVRVLPG